MNDLEKYNNLLIARSRSYSPYSKFKVGAMVILKDGSIFFGCNVENSSYGLSMCAERNAIYNCIVNGYNASDIVELCCLADSPKPISPCGACRQVMSEFLDENTTITLFNLKQEKKEFKLKDLLPYSFSDEDLK